MKNLKKTLAVVLAFAMIFSMGLTSMAAYSDVAEGTKVSEAVGILSNLGILTGFEDGTFKPDETVTRAQMAAIICRTLGYEDQAKSSAGSTIFNDVAADHWAAGYINVAQSLQIVNGYGDGNFGPEDQVTYEQAVKMIVVALGYELDAQAKGGWSTGYLAVASREGITKNANGTVGAEASRGTIAVLVYNSLEVRLMDQNSWSTNGEDDTFGKTNDTILSKYLEIDKIEGVVTSVPFVDFAQNYTSDADQMITFANNSKRFIYEEGKLEEKALNQYRYDISLVPEANNMAGKKVVAYVGQEQDDVTGHYMVYAIAEKQGANTVTTISAAQLVESGDKNYDETGMIAYKGVGSSAITSLELEYDAITASINYGRNTATVGTTATLAAAAGTNGIITLISNDADSKIDVIQIIKYSSEAVIETVENEEGVLTFTFFKGSIDEIDTDNDNKLVVVVKDGVVATAEALAANDTVSEVVVNRNFRVLYVSSKTVTGTVDSYYDDLVTIAGEDYEISALSNYKTLGQVDASLLSGKEGIFFLNVDGQIAADEAVASKGKYGLIVQAGETTGIGSGYEVEVVLADGTVAVYPLNDNAYIVPETGSNIEGATKVYDELKTNVLSADGSVYKLALGNLNKAAYEVSIKNGKVTKLVDLAKDQTVSSAKYDAENLEYGAISFDDETVIYSISTESGFVKADHVTIGAAAELLADEEDSYVLNSYDISNQGYAGLVIGTGIAANVPQDGDALVISSVRVTEIDNSDAYIIYGVQGGEEVTYTLYDEDKTFPNAATDIKVGNVILVGTPNAEGRISAYEPLYLEASKSLATITSDNGEYYYAGDVDESQAPTDTRFYLGTATATGKDATGSSVSSAPASVTMRNAANYTLVDYSENSKNPEVLKKSKSASLFGSFGEYNYKVFVRYFDDAQVEVVVYRYGAEVVKAPTFSLSGTTLTITSATPSATVMYTVDGGTEMTYSAPITVSAGQVVRAWAEQTNCISSATATYVVPTPSV